MRDGWVRVGDEDGEGWVEWCLKRVGEEVYERTS